MRTRLDGPTVTILIGIGLAFLAVAMLLAGSK